MDGDQLMNLQFEDEESVNLYLTQELPDNLTKDYLLDSKGKLEKLLRNVSKNISESIISNQPKYVDELERITNLQTTITESIRVCGQGRSCLKFIKDGTAKHGTTIVEHYKKRQHLAKLLDSLITISELRKSVFQIRQLIDSQEDFPRAIQMCENSKTLLSSFQKFKCIDDMKRNLGLMILKHDFSCYPFDEFIRILGIIDMVVRIGNEFCCNAPSEQSDNLRESINTKALDLFNAYHKSAMDELKIYLENELWERVPVKNYFKLVQLKEFSFLRDANSDEDDEFLSSDEEEEEFIPSEEEDDNEDNNEGQNENEPGGEGRGDRGRRPDDMKHSDGRHYLLTKTSGPVLTNSSLRVLRLFGRYIQMMKVLEPISYSIVKRIYHLLDYYTRVVYKKFGPDTVRQPGVPNISNIVPQDLNQSGQAKTTTTDNEPIDPQKAVAVESLFFLVNQLWNLQEYIESLIPSELRPQLKEQLPDLLKARAELNSDLQKVS